MNNEGPRLCIINIPKPRVYPNEPSKNKVVVSNKKVRRSEKIVRKPSNATLAKYLLLGDPSLQRKSIQNDALFFSLTQFAKQQHRIRHKQKIAISIFDRYKITSTDLRNRIHVEDQPNDVETIKDIDDNFFNFVNGRLLNRPEPCYKTLASIINYRLRKKIETGYRNDAIFNIHLNHIKEQKTYDETLNRYAEQVKYLDQFVLEDYKKSMEFLRNWDDLKKKVDLKNIELQNLASEVFTMTSRLVILDYRYTLQQKFGRFLYYLSSPTWRSQNREFALSIEIEATGFDISNSSEDDTFSVLFENLQMQCAGGFMKPALYFVHPRDLMDVFEMIETQERYHFMHVMQMSPLAKSLMRGTTLLKRNIYQDTAAVASTVELFESQVKFHYERSKQLEQKFFKILHGIFYQSVGAFEVLKFRLHLEFCYEKIFNETPINMDIVAIAKAIEDTFMYYLAKLELLQGTSLQLAIKEHVKEEKLKNKKSKDAARELRLFARLENELLKSFAPVPKRGEGVTIPVKKRTEGSVGRQTRSQSQAASITARQLSLSESEREYLLLFTDWTENEDPGLYLHIS